MCWLAMVKLLYNKVDIRHNFFMHTRRQILKALVMNPAEPNEEQKARF